MTEPRTEAGRRLLDGIAALTPDGKRPYLDVDVEAVAAIEHEAVTAALERLRERVEGLPCQLTGEVGCLGEGCVIDRAAVLRYIDEEKNR